VPFCVRRSRRGGADPRAAPFPQRPRWPPARASGHHAGGETFTLADYRQRYGQYHTDADLLDARRLIPFITTPDDHGVENNMDDPAQTLPGLPQERWLVDRFARSRSRWTILAQQVRRPRLADRRQRARGDVGHLRRRR
jgi:phosphodiesterase/alkaline phosphatase D-like protein